MIAVGTALRPALEAALARAPEHAMFPRANLRDHGLWEGEADGAAPSNATRFWLDDAHVPGFALGLTRRGMLLPISLDGLPDMAALARALRGCTVRGAVGEAGPTRAVLGALGLAGLPAYRDVDEPFHAMPLAALEMPPGPGRLVPATDHRATALAWRRRFEEELGLPPSPAPEGRDPPWLASGRTGLLVGADGPLAMAGLNAVLPDIVQVGGVYTPPRLRGRGHAGRAVALCLAQARRAGALRATIAAGTPAAARVYRRLGFARIGEVALVLLRAPVAIRAAGAPA